MCGGGGGGDGGLDYQREQDAARKARIEQGKKQLENLFAELEGKEKIAKHEYLNLDEADYRSQIADILGSGRTQVTQRVRVPSSSPGNPYGGAFGNQYGGAFGNQYGGAFGNQYGGAFGNQWVDQTVNSLSAGAQNSLRELGAPINADYSVADYLNHFTSAKNNDDNYTFEETGNIAPIWDQQSQAYLDYANPQLNRQYGDAQKDLAFALSRQGQSSGSVSGDSYADLNKDHQLQQQGISETARGYGNQARADIAGQKQDLLNMLSASADPGAAATAARSSIDSIRTQPSFSILGPLFQNTTAGLAAGYGGYQQGQANRRADSIIYGGDPDRSSGSVRR